MPPFCALAPAAACAMTYVRTGLSSVANAHGSPPSGKQCEESGMIAPDCGQLAAFPARGDLHLHRVWQPVPSGTLQMTSQLDEVFTALRAPNNRAVKQPLLWQTYPSGCQLRSCCSSRALMYDSTVSGSLCHGMPSLDRLPLLGTAGMCACYPVPSTRSKTGLGSSSRTVVT